MMLIEEEQLAHWMDNFYGYGSWDSRMWFIALEEGGGDLPEEVADRLRYFCRVHPPSHSSSLCDLRELYREVALRLEGPKECLYNTLHDYRFGPNAILHGVWKNLIAFVHGYENKALPDLLAYQKNKFALSSLRTEALIKLYPLPSPHHHAWYYSWLEMHKLPFLKSRTQYQESVYGKRIATILEAISTHKPEVVLLYGMTNVTTLKLSIQSYFAEARFKMGKAIKQQIPQHHITRIGDTIIFITTQIPALRHNRIETGFDWYQLGKMVKGNF